VVKDNDELPDGREYLRVSKDSSGRERSNEEQQGDNRDEWAGRLRFVDLPAYRDATSASRYADKARDDWPLLVADIEAGRFGAQVLVLWESSRGSRRNSEWAAFLELCRDHDVDIAVTDDDRIYRLHNPRDMRDLQRAGADNEYESAKTSRRLRRAMRGNVADGLPHGRTLFGYRRIYDRTKSTKALVSQEPDPETAPVVRRIFSLYLAGHSTESVAAMLESEDVPTATGRGRWIGATVRRILANAAYAGRRMHNGVDAGPACWPALVDDSTWERTVARLDARRTRWDTPSTTKMLLTGLARCGRCTERMIRFPGSPNAVESYRCRSSHVFRAIDRLDRYVTKRLLARLAELDLDAPTEDPGVTAARAQVDELRAELDDAMARWKAKTLSLAGYADMEAHLLPQIAEAERQARRAQIPIDIDIPPPDRLAAWWTDDLTGEQRRELVAAWLVAVLVRPVGRGNRNYNDAEFTEIEWRR
jgi:site-specific DNA recombinase